MATDVITIPKEDIKLRWKEPYVSGGLNQKNAGIIPAGIYRGLLLGVHTTDLHVSITPDPEAEDHLAVFESATGYSTTYRYISATPMDADLSTYANSDAVLTLYVDYQIAADTAAYIRVYTVAELDALLISDPEEYKALVILGTVTVPNSGAIPVENITYTRRTYAWQRRPIFSMNWLPALKNASFEHGPIDDTSRFAVTSWVTGAVNGDWRLVDTGTPPGQKGLEWRVTATSPVSTGSAKQLVDIPVREGQLVKVKTFKQVFLAAISGVGRITVDFRDENGEVVSWSDADILVTSVDGGPVSVEATFPVPAGVHYIYKIGVSITAEYGSTGQGIQFQEIQAWLEPTPEDSVPVLDRGGARQVADLLVADSDATSPHYENLVGLLRFRHDTPGGEGSFSFQRKDQDDAPAVHIPGRLIGLGEEHLDDAATARDPRVSVPVYDGTSTEFTLVSEYSTGGTDKLVRHYMSAGGVSLWTINASWDGAAWNKDITGDPATCLRQSPNEFEYQIAEASDDSWTAWLSQVEMETDPPVTRFGSGWRGGLSTPEKAEDARISIPPRYRSFPLVGPVTEEDERTLLAISTAGTTDGRAVRLYRRTVSNTDASAPSPREEAFEISFNCSWSNVSTEWAGDDTGEEAQIYKFTSDGGFKCLRQEDTSTEWGDNGWQGNDGHFRDVICNDGIISFGFTDTVSRSNPDPVANPGINRLVSKNTPKAWAHIRTGPSPLFIDGYNFDSASLAVPDDIQLSLWNRPLNACVLASVSLDDSQLFGDVNYVIATKTRFNGTGNVLVVNGHNGTGSVDFSSVVVHLNILVFGTYDNVFP